MNTIESKLKFYGPSEDSMNHSYKIFADYRIDIANSIYGSLHLTRYGSTKDVLKEKCINDLTKFKKEINAKLDETIKAIRSL